MKVDGGDEWWGEDIVTQGSSFVYYIKAIPLMDTLAYQILLLTLARASGET